MFISVWQASKDAGLVDKLEFPRQCGFVSFNPTSPAFVLTSLVYPINAGLVNNIESPPQCCIGRISRRSPIDTAGQGSCFAHSKPTLPVSSTPLPKVASWPSSLLLSHLLTLARAGFHSRFLSTNQASLLTRLRVLQNCGFDVFLNCRHQIPLVRSRFAHQSRHPEFSCQRDFFLSFRSPALFVDSAGRDSFSAF